MKLVGMSWGAWAASQTQLQTQAQTQAETQAETAGFVPAAGAAGLADGLFVTDPALGFDSVQTYAINGSGNNPAHPLWGATGTDQARLGPAQFAAGTSDTPVDGPNARVISNAIFANDPNTNDPTRSAYMYAFGQFVDHDIDLTMDQAPDGSNTLNIPVPADDPFFAAGTDISIIRAQVDPATGHALNNVTSYLDLSQVYGSDAATAASLRNADGTLKTSAGDVLPIVQGQFLGGDVRAAENPDLTSVDVLFVREHNHWVAALHAQDPRLDGDQLYAMARAITTAEYQNIVYSEFLPSLLGAGALAPYAGYDASVNPVIFEEFAGAAYRFGHAIVSPVETKIANDGTVLQQQDLIAAAGEAPAALAQFGGADALLRNLAQDHSQAEGVHITSDLLNLLDANPPGDIGDLGAIDVERERDLGLPTFNETRVALGLPAYTSFGQITTDPVLAAKLQAVYGSVNQLDLFVGGQAETPVGGAMVGPTFARIIAMQFSNLRAGDRLFFENQGFAPALLAQIQGTTLSDLIVRDTNSTAIQEDAFVSAVRHASNVASPDPQAPQLVIGIDANNAVIAATPGVADTLVAGAGLHQTLVGGGTSDVFVFVGGGQDDTIAGFRLGQDKLDFEGVARGITYDGAVITDMAGGAMVQVAGNTIFVQGMTAAALGADDFTFDQGSAKSSGFVRVPELHGAGWSFVDGHMPVHAAT